MIFKFRSNFRKNFYQKHDKKCNDEHGEMKGLRVQRRADVVTKNEEILMGSRLSFYYQFFLLRKL